VFVRDDTAVAVPGPSGGGLTSVPLVASDYDGLLAPGQPPVDRTVPLPGMGTLTPTTTTVR
jgi:hypothetical protein